MKIMLLSLLLFSLSAMADEEVIDVPTPQELPATNAAGPDVSPEQAGAIIEKLKAAQVRKQEENRLLEELEREE